MVERDFSTFTRQYVGPIDMILKAQQIVVEHEDISIENFWTENTTMNIEHEEMSTAKWMPKVWTQKFEHMRPNTCRT